MPADWFKRDRESATNTLPALIARHYRRQFAGLPLNASGRICPQWLVPVAACNRFPWSRERDQGGFPSNAVCVARSRCRKMRATAVQSFKPQSLDRGVGSGRTTRSLSIYVVNAVKPRIMKLIRHYLVLGQVWDGRGNPEAHCR